MPKLAQRQFTRFNLPGSAIVPKVERMFSVLVENISFGGAYLKISAKDVIDTTTAGETWEIFFQGLGRVNAEIVRKDETGLAVRFPLGSEPAAHPVAAGLARELRLQEAGM
jgi:hypothetical protein